MTVHHLLEAELEILDAVSFYKARGGDLAVNFYEEFNRAREEIAALPEFWGVWPVPSVAMMSTRCPLCSLPLSLLVIDSIPALPTKRLFLFL
ncbi:MAG: hypothetical protein ACO3RV_00780 [Luteolibacter sp.]